MPPERNCPDCGLALPSIEEGVGCPHCLFRLAMGDESEANEPAEPTTIPRGLRSRFFGDYEILSELARGGMGVIYRARQISLNRVVALKMIQPDHLPSPEAWLRFQTEIAVSAQLNHPNIVALHESGTVDGAHFFTMRLMEGGNFAMRLAAERQAGGAAAPFATPRTSRETQGTVVRLLIKVARAVHYAHQRGVLHRDLKPSNLLLDEHGEPQVADFGLAKMLAKENDATLTDSILGSPNYMAPEQADGRGRNVTVTTDVYGLGAILYEALTGLPPFQARTPVETIRKVLDDEPVPPRKLNPGINPDLETICLKCLQKIPATRYLSAEDLAADLESWLQDRPIRARPVGPLGTIVRWSRRHPALATVSALLGLLLVVGAFGAALAVLRIRQAEQTTVAHLRESLVAHARVLNLTSGLGRRGESLRLLREAAALGGDESLRARVRDEVLAALALSDLEFSPQARLPATRPEWVLIDPRMERLAWVSNATNLVVQRLADGHVLQHLALGRAAVMQLEAFSPDGRYLAVRTTAGLVFYDTDTGRVIFSASGSRWVFCFAAHAAQVVLAEQSRPECEASIRELPSFREVGRLRAAPNPGDRNLWGWRIISLSPDGRLFAGARFDRLTLELIEVATGRTLWRQPQPHSTHALAWQPSQRQLVAAFFDGTVALLRESDGTTAAQMTVPPRPRHLALDDASSLLAVAGEDRSLRVLQLDSRRLVFEGPTDSHRLAFAADGKKLATIIRGDAVGFFELAKSEQFREILIASPTNSVNRCAFSADGRTLAIGYPGRVALFTGTALAACGEVGVGALPVFALDPRGEELLTSDINGVTRRPLPGPSPAKLDHALAALVIPDARWRALAYSADGSRLWAANASSNRVFAYSRDFSSVLASCGPHPGVDAVAASPDGRWLATGSSRTRNVKVWDLASGTNLATFAAGKIPRIDFSADGRWLLMHGEEFALRAVGSWQPGPPLPFPDSQPTLGAAAISHDGRILAVVENQFTVRLFDLSTWQPLGLLRTPTAGTINALAFNPDGSRLVAACTHGHLRLWELHAIRQELAALNLDWNLPAPPKAPRLRNAP